jgi:hypothetical protein
VLGKAAFPIRLALAVLLEGIWEVAENTDFIILRYRSATTSFDYFGDSIVNSIADSITMLLGFMAASQLPAWSTLSIAIIIELALGYLIRDNLTLNIIMMILPSEAISAWQAAAPLR